MNPRKEPIVILSKNKKLVEKNTSQVLQPEYDYLFKFQLVGDFEVGKSSLLRSYIEKTDTDNLSTDYGFYDFKTKKIVIEGKKITIRIWDPARQERFTTTHGANAFILVFDFTDLVSFNNLEQFLEQHSKNINTNTKIILVGTKTDVVNKRVVEDEKIEEFISKHNIEAYIETSAKTGENVKLVFQTTAKLVFDWMQNQVLPKNSINPRKILITDFREYIARIETNKISKENDNVNFRYGFWHHKNSRALNREANYYLAKDLLDRLENSSESIESIFTDVNAQRNALITKHNLQTVADYKNRGINSRELNTIINKAGKFAKQEKTSLQVKPR